MRDDIMVSVVMTTYNHRNFIKQAVESVLMQKTNFRYELIIGDDCSPDNSKEVLIQFKNANPDIINLIIREKNIGGTKNLYDLFMRARGKYVILLEGDDYWTDEFKLKKQVYFLEQHPEFIGVAHKNAIVDEYGNSLIVENYYERNYREIYTIQDLHSRGLAFQSATLLYKNIYIGSDNKYEKLFNAHQIIADIQICYLLLDIGDVYIMDEMMSAWRCYISNTGTNWASISKNRPIQNQIDNLLIYKALDRYFSGKYKFKTHMYMRIAECYLAMLRTRKTEASGQLIHLISKLSPFETVASFPYALYYIGKLVVRKLSKKSESQNFINSKRRES